MNLRMYVCICKICEHGDWLLQTQSRIQIQCKVIIKTFIPCVCQLHTYIYNFDNKVDILCKYIYVLIYKHVTLTQYLSYIYVTAKNQTIKRIRNTNLVIIAMYIYIYMYMYTILIHYILLLPIQYVYVAIGAYIAMYIYLISYIMHVSTCAHIHTYSTQVYIGNCMYICSYIVQE